jgi:hypothetical protein
MRNNPTTPLSHDQVQRVHALHDRTIRDTLNELADRLELEPDPLGVRKAFARGLRPDPSFPDRLDS